MIWFVIVLGAVIWLAESYSLKHGLDQLTLSTSTDKVLVEPDEPFLWKLTVRNGKRMMVPYLKIKESVPGGLLFAESREPVEKKEIAGLTSELYLSGRQTLTLERRVCLTARGRYFFRGTTVEAGDFCGVKSSLDSFQELKEIVVKPRESGSVKLYELLGGFLGEYSVRRNMMEDPLLTIGFREYTGREPFKSISWNQSARNNRLLVKQYDCTADLSCTVLVNVQCPETENRKEKLEACYRAARSVCQELEKRRITYDFYTNGVIAGTMGSWSSIGEGLGNGHLEAVLESLGRMIGEPREGMEEFLTRILKGARAGRAYIVLTPERSTVPEAGILRLKTISGMEVLVLTPEEMEE